MSLNTGNVAYMCRSVYRIPYIKYHYWNRMATEWDRINIKSFPVAVGAVPRCFMCKVLEVNG